MTLNHVVSEDNNFDDPFRIICWDCQQIFYEDYEYADDMTKYKTKYIDEYKSFLCPTLDLTLYGKYCRDCLDCRLVEKYEHPESDESDNEKNKKT